MESRRVSDTFGLFFTPDQWSAARRFSQFIGRPFNDREVEKGTRSTLSHLNKFDTLAALANRLVPRLSEDQVELERDGHSAAARGREFAALMETLVCELYASLDGVRRAVFGAYRTVQAVQNSSTEKLFKRAAEWEYGETFPEEVRAVLASAYSEWFPSLKKLRTELTHGDIGSCHLDANSGAVRYVHGGLGTGSRAMVVEDIVDRVNGFAAGVLRVAEAVFAHLYSNLESDERQIMCGIYKGRIYERLVKPEARLTFNSGQCFSKSWFDLAPGFECPLRSRCGAYHAD